MDPFLLLRQAVQQRFEDVRRNTRSVFTTDAQGLYDLFLATLPRAVRQTYNCRVCRAFVTRYGGLAVLDDDGIPHAMLWTPWPEQAGVPGLYVDGVTRLHDAVQQATITGVFFSPLAVWGLPHSPSRANGPRWEHLAIQVPWEYQYHEFWRHTAWQGMEHKQREFEALRHVMHMFPPELVTKAQAWLANEPRPRPWNALGITAWVLTLYVQLSTIAQPQRRSALLWRALGLERDDDYWGFTAAGILQTTLGIPSA